jgi:intracellular multiplication protein IcmC
LVFLVLVSFALTGCGTSLPGASSLTIQQMVVNIAETIPNLVQMTTAGAYILGLMLVMRGVYKLKEYGEARTMMASQTNIWPPLITLTVGSMLIYFPSAYQIGLETLFKVSEPSPLSYQGNADLSEQTVEALGIIVQLVGCIAFIRGMLLINSATGHGAQPGSYGKGLAFIIGGLLGINIFGTWEVIVNTLTGT